jgi:MarR family protein
VPESGLPPEVERFLDEHISSVGQLEVLLLLRARPGGELAPAEVARALGIDDGFATAELRELAAHGLLEERGGTPPRFRYAPATSALGDAVTAVDQAYATRRLSVVNRIVAKPSPTIRAFADAFRLRKE